MTRLALVGAGNIVRTHLENLDTLAGHDDVDVVAVCDVNETAATEAATPYDAAVYGNHEQMYDEEDFDAVLVGVPPFAHSDQELLAAERDASLLVEKPLAVESELPREIERAITESSGCSQVGHMYRYAEITERAMELVSERDLALAVGQWHAGVPGVAWWKRRDQSGGQIVEQATHTYDVIRHFAGDVSSVSATGGQQVVTEEIDFEDATTANLVHENGVVSSVTATSAAPGIRSDVTLVGDGFRLTLDFIDNRLSGVFDGEDVDFEGEADHLQTSAMARELDAFLTAVKTDDESLLRSPYADARRTFELTLAAQESIDTGESIRMEERV